MALIVQKYGGTSVGNLDCIRHVADRVLKTQAEGHKLVIVVSAMHGETDRLVALAETLSENPSSRELDVLLATGEQVSIALLTMALVDKGCDACSYTGGQVYIRTDNVHNKARILGIDVSRIHADLALGRVVVVAGFQGVDDNGNITTLGRGGSDTTAVALAAALQADECQIYTDVEGVYTADPKMVPFAKRMPHLTSKEMIELSSLGAKVMQIRAIEFAAEHEVPVRVLSTFKEGAGTLITGREYNLSDAKYSRISGITHSKDEVKFRLRGLPNHPGMISQILSPLSDAEIEVDMIIQTQGFNNNQMDLMFLVYKRDLYRAKQLVSDLQNLHNHLELFEGIAKISLVGAGLRSHPRVASTLFQALGNRGIHIRLIATSESKVSVVIDEKHLMDGLNILHEVFQLGKEQNEQGFIL